MALTVKHKDGRVRNILEHQLEDFKKMGFREEGSEEKVEKPKKKYHK